MAEYITKEQVKEKIMEIEKPYDNGFGNYIDSIDFEDEIDNIKPADVIERSKIDKALKEMDNLASHKVRPISFDQSVAIDMCINIIKRNIGE